MNGSMKNGPRSQGFKTLAASLLLILAAGAYSVRPAEAVTPEEVTAIGLDAYIYGYPLVTMEMTRRVMTNVPKPEGTRAPMGQFVRMRAYPTAAYRDVTAPNADTLYTVAWIDVAKEPWVLSVPEMGERYWLFPMLDGWTDVFQVPGKRTTGTKAKTYAITGPDWKGKLPQGVREYKSPTALVWILGRIYCSGTPADYKAVHALQDQFKLAPLSSYGKKYTPPPGMVDPAIDMKTAVREQVNRMDAGAYFKLLAQLLKDNPPAAADTPILARMAQIGIVPGQDFDITKLEPALAQGLQNVPKAAFEKIMAHFKDAGKIENGWMFSTQTGVYGTDYLQRAFITAIGLGANRPEDAIYPSSEAAANGKPYEGANRYVIRFAKGQMPPVNGFWSLTMYDADYFFVANPLDRYTLSSRSKFKTNQDGSVDLYIQNASPGKNKEANWLPAPAGRFNLMFRFYWPQRAIIDGTWKMPEVMAIPHLPG